MSISTVTSEALQLKLRQLLPSQQGFGTDLTAQDTIVPIIDLTAAAEGSDVPEDLQQALDSSTNTEIFSNTTRTIVNNTGFFRVSGTITLFSNASAAAKLEIFDGSAANVIFNVNNVGSEGNTAFSIPTFFVFLRAGDILRGVSPNGSTPMSITTRQVADINGTLVQPTGFTPQ